MARYGPGDAAISVASQSIADCTVIGDIDDEMIIEEITPIGADDETFGSVGVKRHPELMLEAPYSDDANLLRDKCDDTGLGGTATILITLGGTKTKSASYILRATKRKIERGKLTAFQSFWQQTGQSTEA